MWVKSWNVYCQVWRITNNQVKNTWIKCMTCISNDYEIWRQSWNKQEKSFRLYCQRIQQFHKSKNRDAQPIIDRRRKKQIKAARKPNASKNLSRHFWKNIKRCNWKISKTHSWRSNWLHYETSLQTQKRCWNTKLVNEVVIWSIRGVNQLLLKLKLKIQVT